MKHVFATIYAVISIIIKLPSILLALVYKPYRVRRIHLIMDGISKQIIRETPVNDIQDPKRYFSNLIEQVFIDKKDVHEAVHILWDNNWVPKYAPEFVFDTKYMAAVIGRVWMNQIHESIKEQCEKYSSNQQIQFETYKHTMQYLANLYIFHDKFDELVLSYQPRLSALYNVTQADYNEESFYHKIDVDLERHYHTTKIKELFKSLLGGKMAERMAEDLNERS